MSMQTSIHVKIVRFGQISFETHKLIELEKGKEKISEEKKTVHYAEPETAGVKTFEVLYEQESIHYVIPPTTG